RRPVLRAAVAELAVDVGRVDVSPEHLDEFLEADPARVIDHLNRFGMSGPPGRNLRVGGIGGFAVGVTRGGREHAVDLVEGWFHAPETAPGEGGYGVSLRRLRCSRIAVRQSEERQQEECVT